MTAASPAPETIRLSARAAAATIPGLDAVRGLSALLVVLAHAGLIWRQWGALGVAAFFVLSGFLITTLLLKEHAYTKDISLRNFYARRTLRIFPAFYVFWGVTVLSLFLSGAARPWRELVASFFYMGDYYSALGLASALGEKTAMGITWSLGIEEKFYLIWPWVFRRYRNRPETLLKFSCWMIGLIWVYRVACCVALQLPRDYLRYAFESRFDNILYGCVAALLVRSGRLDTLGRRIARHVWLPLFTAGAITASVFLEERYGGTFHYGIGMPLDAILAACLMLQLIVLSATPVWAWVDCRPLRYAGALSYSLYLYHPLCFRLSAGALAASRWRVQLLAGCVASGTAATLSYHLVEKPFLKLKQRYSSKPPATPPCVGSSAAAAAAR